MTRTPRSIVFHHPMDSEGREPSGSTVRPAAMRRAFEELGLRVHEVTGSHRERVERFAEARASFQSGGRFAFVYSESSTMPTLLTEPDHRPRWPLVDYALFFWARRNRIPLYLFYRDLHWRFEHYRSTVSPLKRVVAKSFYHLDLWVYRRVLDRLLLPTLEMAKALPFELPRVDALPPGHAALPGARPRRSGERLRLVYVGGTGPLYRYGALLEAVSRRADVELFLCTRALEFGRYGPKRLPENVRLLHASGDELAAIYRACDVACIVVDPSPYWTLTRPVKLYEALGYGLPLLVTEGLGFSRWVEHGGLGWSVPYEASAIEARLARLARAPELVRAAAARARREAPHHTWKARAQQVLDMNALDVDSAAAIDLDNV